MKKEELLKTKRLLERIKDPDGFVKEIIAYVDKDLALRECQRKNLRDWYESDFSPY